MKSLVPHILAILLLALSISAQENQPVLIDEFGKMPLDETMARMHAFGNEIRKTPRSKALIRVYGGRELGFTYSYSRGSVLKALWENNRKLPPEDLSIQFCDVDQAQLYTEFYVVREGDRVEVCEENFIIPEVATRFETVGFFSDDEFKLAPLENVSVDFGFTDGEYSGFAFDVLKRSLNLSPKSRLYVIAYLRTNFETDDGGKIISKPPSALDDKTDVGKMLRAARKELLKKGFSDTQIVTVDGGYINSQERRLEFWFVPQGGEIPQPQPDYVPKKKRGQ